MVKKITSLLLALLLLCALPASALADVIWEPYDDSFYNNHHAECVYNGRNYTANEELTVYKEPGKADSGSLPKDTAVRIAFIYTDESGESWGVCEADNSYWLPMNSLTLIYDNTAFFAEHSNELQPATQPDAALFTDGMALYDYPNSPASMPLSINDIDLPVLSLTYTDENGDAWGRIDYYMGQEGWIRLTGDNAAVITPAPEAQQAVTALAIDADSASVTAVAVDTDNTPAAARDKSSSFVLPAVLVIAVVLVAVILMLVFFRKKKA